MKHHWTEEFLARDPKDLENRTGTSGLRKGSEEAAARAQGCVSQRLQVSKGHGAM